MINLTDDMFVVEAASFVVPYVLEKPAEIKIGQFLRALEPNTLEKIKTDVMESDGINEDAEKQKTQKIDDVICDEEATRNLNEKINPKKTRKKGTKKYIDSPIGSFFIKIGENLVKERVQFELLELYKKKMDIEKISQNGNIEGIRNTMISLTDDFMFTKEINAAFNFSQRTCEYCNYKTESLLIMAHHVETSHMKKNIFTRNFTTRGPQEISLHVESAHATQPKITTMSQQPNSLLVNSNLDAAKTGTWPKQLMGAPVFYNGQVYKPDRSNLSHNTGNVNLMQQSTSLTRTVLSAPGLPSELSSPAILTPPIFKIPAIPSKLSSPLPEKPFVICEICDGYIQSMELFRKHLYWIHKINVHPKVMTKRPPLYCEKCQFRFFTDQGLERHLLGSHGLVTTSMQQAALRSEDSGRCPTCGRVYQWKLLEHITRDHGVNLKPALLSYKCYICSTLFPQYEQFAEHVYSTHKMPKTKPDESNNNV